MVQTIKYWRSPDQPDFWKAPGIAVVTDDDKYILNHPKSGEPYGAEFPRDFGDRVHDALRYIRATPGGQRIVASLAGPGPVVTIVPAQLGNSVRALGDGALHKVAEELIPQSLIGDVTRAALRSMTKRKAEWPKWLAKAINGSPELLQEATPDAGTGFFARLEKARQHAGQWSLLTDWRFTRWSNNEGSYNDQRLGGSFAAGSFDIGITDEEAAEWIAGNPLPARLSQRERNHALVATLVALHNLSPSGAGCASVIGWNPYDSNPLNASRPAAIGLAHELVHAFYNKWGRQPGRDFGDPTTVLFEFLCVGLGPWDETQCSENGIRRDWLSHAVPLIPEEDRQSRKAMPKRIRYL